jgi:hypothetical protein
MIALTGHRHGAEMGRGHPCAIDQHRCTPPLLLASRGKNNIYWEDAEVKYYLYISDAKLEMLYGQMPVKIRDKIAAELKIDLKVIGATVSIKDRPETRYSKLDLVREYLITNFPVGSIAHPDSYFSGTVPMQWGLITSPESGKVVYFGGNVDNVVLGLAGSRHHVVGYQGEGVVGAPDFSYGSSFAPMVIKAIEDGLAAVIDRPETAESGSVIQLRERHPVDFSKTPDARALDTVLYATENLLGPTQRLEFLAKRLLMGKVSVSTEEKVDVLLGTPLYVALAD